MLVDASGARISSSAKPQPNDLTIQRMNEQLQRLDSLLHVRWIEYAAYGPHGFEGRYALCSWWPKVDKRWQEVQSGKWDPASAYDHLGWLNENMHDSQSVPLTEEAMTNKALELLGKCDNTRQPWAERMRGAIAKNKALTDKRKAAYAETAALMAGEMVGIKSGAGISKRSSSPSSADLEGFQRELEQEFDNKEE